jgi:hypothetical protein
MSINQGSLTNKAPYKIGHRTTRAAIALRQLTILTDRSSLQNLVNYN